MTYRAEPLLALPYKKCRQLQGIGNNGGKKSRAIITSNFQR